MQKLMGDEGWGGGGGLVFLYWPQVSVDHTSANKRSNQVITCGSNEVGELGKSVFISWEQAIF